MSGSVASSVKFGYPPGEPTQPLYLYPAIVGRFVPVGVAEVVEVPGWELLVVSTVDELGSVELGVVELEGGLEVDVGVFVVVGSVVVGGVELELLGVVEDDTEVLDDVEVGEVVEDVSDVVVEVVVDVSDVVVDVSLVVVDVSLVVVVVGSVVVVDVSVVEVVEVVVSEVVEA